MQQLAADRLPEPVAVEHFQTADDGRRIIIDFRNPVNAFDLEFIGRIGEQSLGGQRIVARGQIDHEFPGLDQLRGIGGPAIAALQLHRLHRGGEFDESPARIRHLERGCHRPFGALLGHRQLPHQIVEPDHFTRRRRRRFRRRRYRASQRDRRAHS
ncbi:hypothetical protein SDC9_113651 [bioreactor metagenome]|uniref:Uncharacterized protein n=1 Tax=bioreactor metagenome TaxID=1076179 RepID=A0A645BMN3_9ZZZZ